MEISGPLLEPILRLQRGAKSDILLIIRSKVNEGRGSASRFGDFIFLCELCIIWMGPGLGRIVVAVKISLAVAEVESLLLSP